MKLIHLSDLHIGKRLNEFSMIEDQKYILAQILSIVEKEQAESVAFEGKEIGSYQEAVQMAVNQMEVDICLTRRILKR